MIYNVNNADFLNSEFYKKFINANPALGFLKIRAYAARGAVPISGMRVVISKDIGEDKVVFFEGVTNDSGVIERIALPTPQMALDNMVVPVINQYDINTTYDGGNYLYKVNIYDSIYVVQNVNVETDIGYGVNY